MRETNETSVNSALQRARATLGGQAVPTDDDPRRLRAAP